MRSGRMTHTIGIERVRDLVSPAGAAVQDWQHVATLRAELVEISADEFLRNAGEIEEGMAVFRTRYLPNFSVKDRIKFRHQPYEIVSLSEINRRRGLEFKCKAVRV